MYPALHTSQASSSSSLAPEKQRHSDLFPPPTSNAELVRLLGLQSHPEGGFFAETDREAQEIPSPYAEGQLRPLSTTIYYLLTYEAPSGVFHLNKSVTMHVHHRGRAEYTLIHPATEAGSPPRVETVIVGPNLERGETLQLLVGSNVWKKSRLLDEDLAAADRDQSLRAHTGCLITEVVFPGFHWEDHRYLRRAELAALWGGAPGWEVWAPFVKADEEEAA